MIDNRMTKIEDLEDKVMSVKDAVNNNNQKTIEFFTIDHIFYQSVFTNEVFTLSNHLMESDKLLAFFKSVV